MAFTLVISYLLNRNHCLFSPSAAMPIFSIADTDPFGTVLTNPFSIYDKNLQVLLQIYYAIQRKQHLELWP